jgi:hypothetical protein
LLRRRTGTRTAREPVLGAKLVDDRLAWVAKDLFVVAHGEETSVAILAASLGGRAADELYGAIAVAVNFIPPLRLE